MLNQTIRAKIIEEQNKFLELIYKAGQETVVPSLPLTSILRTISTQELPEHEVWKKFKTISTQKLPEHEIWKKLKTIIDYFDIEHPDLNHVFNGAFSNNFSKLLNEIIYLNKLINEKGFSEQLSHSLNKSIYKFKEYDLIKKHCSNGLANTNFLVRFFFSRDLIAEKRKSKSMQKVDMRLTYKKINTLWHSQPETFYIFRRFFNLYEEDFDKFNRKMSHFKELGCSFLADQMNRNIQEFLRSQPTTYHGFNRIKLSNACIVLAKLHSFRMFEMEDSSIHLYDELMKEYSPKYYTHLEILNSLPSKQMEKLIEFLDNFPPFRNKPLFDHYRVLFPGVDTVEDDFYLIESGNVVPVLIGERDDSCYFISYWL